MIISIIGSGEPTEEISSLAEQVGKELALRNVMIICGGLGGVMESACRGAKSVGGTTIGILPGNSPKDANKWVDIPICTGMSHARNVIIVKSSAASIAIGGAFGTLSEIGHALAENIPVIGLKTWELSKDGERNHSLIIANNPKEAVDKAIEAADNRATSP